MSDKTLILGIGNTLLGDEGVGVHVLDVLRHQHPRPAALELVDGETLGLELVPAIGGAAHLIVIDAARFGRPPGTVRMYQGQAMDRFVAAQQRGRVSKIGLRELLTAARLAGQLPRRRALIGIQPERVDWSERLTDGVERAIPRASELARELVMRWRQ